MSYFKQLVSEVPYSEELSDRRYNLTLGLTLGWGFLLNYLLLRYGIGSIYRWMYRFQGGYSGMLLAGLVAYFVLVMTGNALLRTQKLLNAVIGYHMIVLPVGLLASMAIATYDPFLVTRAVLLTAVGTLTMMLAATLNPQFFMSMGRGLGTALLCTIIAESVGILLFRMPISLIDWAVVSIMCMYIGFDWVRANSCAKTAVNAICAASALYLDIINILLRILRILARSRDRD